MTNTAEYRDLALQAEAMLLWETAAAFWQCAIAAYRASPKSELARHDIRNMEQRKADCESMR